MSLLKLHIISPSGEIFNGEVEHATFPGEVGTFAVFPLHAPLISALSAGEIRYYPVGEEKLLEIQGGFVEVKDDFITVCVE